MRKLLALTASVALAACATSSATPPDTTNPAVTTPVQGTTSASSPAGASVPWRATLQPMNGSNITGSATVTPASTSAMTATVNISGATAGDVHPWHVHNGTCATGGGVVGPGSAYTPLTVAAGGSASSTASIPAVLDATQKYHVNIHKSPTDMGTIVACGDLAPSST
jgi:hypothetical protein